MKVTTNELYEVAQLSFMEVVIRADQVALFPRDKRYLIELWQCNVKSGTPFRIETEGKDE